MYTNELAAAAKRLKVHNFMGVFALDQLPSHLPRHCTFSFIVNTDTSNLPGRHWLAVSYEKGGIVRAFDPFGAVYPHFLRTRLARFAGGIPGGRVLFNRKMIQHPLAKNCGPLCLKWLVLRTHGTCMYVCIFVSILFFHFSS